MPPNPEKIEILRAVQRSAGDKRKILLTVYGLLLFVPLALLVVATFRSLVLDAAFWSECQATFLRPVGATVSFLSEAFSRGQWAVMGGFFFALWLVATLVASFFGLAVTRMAAIELTCDRRADVSEAIQFARSHWHWAFLTPACLLMGGLLLTGLAAACFSLGRISEYLLVIGVPLALVFSIGAVVLLIGLWSGGILAWSTIATEWSDAFDAITRVYGYSFTHSYRLLLYRAGGLLAWLGAVLTRTIRAGLVVGVCYAALLIGLGHAGANSLIDSVLLEAPTGIPFPRTVAAWTLLGCATVFLTMFLARLLVFRIVLRQAIYLLLRHRIDRVPLDSIDGYRPDDSDFDPTAQGFELIEVEEEIPAE